MTDLLPLVLHGATPTTALLLGAVGLLLYERRRVLVQVDAKDQRFEALVEKYEKANHRLADALDGLRMVMIELKSLQQASVFSGRRNDQNSE